MLKLNETTDLVEYATMPVTRSEIDSYSKAHKLSPEKAERAIRGVRIFWTLSGAMTEPECRDEKCKWIAVTSEAYKLMQEYLPAIASHNYLEEISEEEIDELTKGHLAKFMGAWVIIDETKHIPKGYGKDYTREQTIRGWP